VVACRSCGFDNAAGIKFCGECGTRLDVPASPANRERKVVSVLFCDLVAFTAASDGADPEEIQARLSPYHARARAEIERFGGTVEKFIGDAVMAAFGAPTAHEDDPERAVRAGLALLRAVDELNVDQHLDLSVRVGIATGEAVVSTDARPERGEGMLAGDVVNTAARLQTAAPVGSVLVGQTTRDATRAVIEYDPHDPVTVKGKADPLAVWVAVRARGSVGEALADTTTPMVGRIEELGILQRAYTRAVRESSVQLVTIVAEPGLGKSRLVQAFGDWIDGRDELVTWRQGGCPSYGDAVTFAALGQIVKAQTGILDTDPSPLAIQKLTDTVHALVTGTDLAEQEPWLVARLAPLVGQPALEAPQVELFNAWRLFLETLATTSPLIVVVEDLHWADPALLDFLAHLLDEVVGVPLMIIATARPELFDKAATWGAGHRNSTTLSLVPLTDVETAQVVASLLGTKVLPADLHSALLATAAGNPLYTREYLNLVVGESGTTATTSPQAVADLAATLPGSVQAVIAARLDTLAAPAKRLLQAAAVVGHTFWVGAVAALCGLDELAISGTLHDLVRRDYLRRSRTSRVAGQSEYTFTHALIADVAYQQLPRQTRSDHHRVVGDWHTALAAKNGADGQAAVIAHHYHQAHDLLRASGGDPAVVAELAAKAATWHGRSARLALATDPAMARTHVEVALGLTSAGQPEHPDLLNLLGDICTIDGSATVADSAYQGAHDEYLAQGDPIAAALADVHRSDILTTLSRMTEAMEVSHEAVRVLEQHPAGPELLEGYVTSASRFFMQGLFRRAIDRADQALELAERIDTAPPHLIARALRVRGGARVWSAEEGAEQDLTAALELAQIHNLSALLINIYGQLSGLKCLAETAQAGIPYAQHALTLAQERGQRRLFISTCDDLANSLTVAGRIDEAIALLQTADPVLSEIDVPSEAAGLLQTRSWLLLIRGDFEQAAELIAGALPALRGGQPSPVASALLIAIGCASTGAPLDVNDLTAELVTTLQDPQTDPDVVTELPGLARVLCVAGHRGLVNRIIEHTPTGMRLYDNDVLAARAVLAESDGDPGRALQLYLEAARAWADYGCPLEQAQAHLGAARCLAAIGEPARGALLAARDLLREIGARLLLCETEAMLDQAGTQEATIGDGRPASEPQDAR
jgi:class 3 adenylate cyclase/tetratricopeptide (TPR) repeat protein